MTLPIPPSVLYAGLAGVFLSLVVATATNGWQLRVFVLLALRLAIGWHFLFEGLHKLHSFAVGPTDTNKVFTSEPYFAAAEGPLGDFMRKKYLGDPEAVYTERLKRKKELLATEFDKLTRPQQAELCPDWLAPYWEGTQDAAVAKATADRDKASLDKEKAAADAKKLADDLAKLDAAGDKAKAWAAKPQADAAKKKVDDLGKAIAAYDERIKEMASDKAEGFARQKARFAAWLYGSEALGTKVNMVSGDVSLTANQRLSALAILERELAALDARETEGFGRGYGYEMERRKKLVTELRKAKAELAADVEKFADDLRADAGLPALDKPADKPIKDLDKLTAYTITAVGAGLLLGCFTKLWCLVGFGFLVMTYLSHPTVPWLPLPPNTEGNPLFINKNLIEALALLVVFVHPTGRWLGLDALFTRIVCGSGAKKPPLPA